MTASFVTGGAVDLAPALAIMLGANVGTTLIVQALSFNVTAVAPLLFLVGVIAFKRGGQTRTRDLGCVAIGIGLMLLSLHILLDTLAPAEEVPVVRTLLTAITGDALLCVLMAAVADLDRAFERHGRIADHVAGLLWLYHAGASTRPHTWR
jgi:phosphate:Na+ symporter